MASKTTDQKIKAAEAQLARLKKKKRSQLNSQKIILGGMVMANAKQPENHAMRGWILKAVPKLVTREADRTRVQPVLDELREIEHETQNRHQPPQQHKPHEQ